MQPLNDRVLIQRLPEETRIGSVYLPDTARRKAILGIVIKAGIGKWHPGEWWYVLQPDGTRKWEWLEGWREDPWVKEGQVVYFNSTHDDAASDSELHMVQFQDIFGVVPD